jgi:serine/threonine protein kinase
MKENDKEKSDESSDMPIASDLTSEELEISAVPPQIEGYEILDELGEAGQGRVWRAMQLSTRREVALKVPRIELLNSRKALARFEREVELVARLKHSNIASIYDSGIYEGVYYYAMELIEGMSLDKYVKQYKLTLRKTLELMCTVCEAIQHAHQNGVIHRDIKPSNIIVTEDGRPYVVDFGLAVSILEGDVFKTISIEGELAGTPAYMSPEQASGHHEQLDTRTDVYSIGVVLYRLLTESFPYDVKSSMLRVLQNIQEAEPIKPSKILHGLDSDVEAILLKVLAKEPNDRYQSVGELQHDIEYWLTGLPITARSDSSIYILRKVIAKHRYTSTVVGLLLVIVLGFSCLSFQLLIRWRQAIKERDEAIASLKVELKNIALLATQAVFSHFLQELHQGDWEQARVIESILPDGSREVEAARFLLDLKSLAEIRKKLQKSEPYFLEFIIAENYFKNGNRAEAIKAYKECLSYGDELKKDDESKKDEWIARWAKGRLYELAD